MSSDYQPPLDRLDELKAFKLDALLTELETSQTDIDLLVEIRLESVTFDLHC